jgi:hydrogenase maturation protease
MSHRILLLGLGNLLLRDEGLGIRALDLLQTRYDLPPEVACIDGGVLGLELLAYIEGLEYLLILDAVRNGQPPGTLVRLEGEAIPQNLSLKLSMHQVRLADILALSRLRGTTPPRLVVWGMEPAVLESGFGLSAGIEARLDALVDAAVDELARWDIAATPRPVDCEPSTLHQISHSLPALNPSTLRSLPSCA